MRRAAIFARLMKSSKQSYTAKHIAASIFSMLLLAWLTVCLPYVNEKQQAVKSSTEKTSENKANSGNPLNNTNEERSESGVSLLSEYLHEAPVIEHHFTLVSTFYKCHPSDLYIAYHPDLIIPPPKV